MDGADPHVWSSSPLTIPSARGASGAGCSTPSSSLAPSAEGQGWQTHPETGLAVGVHERGRGPGDSFSLPYFTVADMDGALARVSSSGEA